MRRNEGGGKAPQVLEGLREVGAHRIPPGRSPEGALAEGSCPAWNAVQDTWG